MHGKGGQGRGPRQGKDGVAMDDRQVKGSARRRDKDGKTRTVKQRKW
jgi:hypothetical protein